MSHREISQQHRSEVRFCRRLLESSRFREETGLFVFAGQRHFLRALEARYDWLRIYLCSRLLNNPAIRVAVKELAAGGVDVRYLSAEEYRMLGLEPRASGIAAIAKQRWILPESIDFQRQPLWIAIGQIRNPGNLGTLLRSATAFGCDGVLLTDEATSPFSSNVLKASMGAIYLLRFARVSIQWLKQIHIAKSAVIIGTSPHGTNCLDALPCEQPIVVFLGEERAGLTSEQLAVCHELIRIDMEPATDSLNLGVAGSLFLHEIYSKRRARRCPQ